eukprot:14020978-Alexandrium_andersonii.AAC.1
MRVRPGRRSRTVATQGHSEMRAQCPAARPDSRNAGFATNCRGQDQTRTIASQVSHLNWRLSGVPRAARGP